MEKAVVILSGGMDSTTLLYDMNQVYSLEALSFNYGSKHNEKEIPLAKYNCEKLGIKHTIINLDLGKYFKSSLLKGGEDIPEGHYAEDNMKSTVVPFRNGIMLSIAVGYAESIGAKKVLLGSHKGDESQYPDCRKEFTQAISLAAQIGTYEKVEIISPYNELMKWDIVKKGLELKVPFEKTWSCYKGDESHCGRCGTCYERTEAFNKNNVKDPVYSDDEWSKALEFIKAKN